MIERDDKLALELQERLIQTCISFAKEKDIPNICAVRFTADYFLDSLKDNDWHPSLDSTCEIVGAGEGDDEYIIGISI